MDYKINNYNSNNDIIIISNKEKHYQKSNDYDNYDNYEVLQSKIIELNNRINFIKNNCKELMPKEDIDKKINSVVENIDLIIEQINFKIINKAQINN